MRQTWEIQTVCSLISEICTVLSMRNAVLRDMIPFSIRALQEELAVSSMRIAYTPRLRSHMFSEKSIHFYKIMRCHIFKRGARDGLVRWLSWLRHCATSQMIACSIPSGVILFSHRLNPFGRSMALRSTQPPTAMSARRISCD